MEYVLLNFVINVAVIIIIIIVLIYLAGLFIKDSRYLQPIQTLLMIVGGLLILVRVLGLLGVLVI